MISLTENLGRTLFSALFLVLLFACASASSADKVSSQSEELRVKTVATNSKNSSRLPSYRFQNIQYLSFPSDEQTAKCADFEKNYLSDAMKFQLCPDGQVAEFPFVESAFNRSQGRDLLSSVVDWRNKHCAEITKKLVVQSGGFKISNGRLQKTTFAGESAFIRYRAPRSINLVAFDYRPSARKSWEGAKYVLFSFTVQTETAKPKAFVELGVDDMGVFYVDVKGVNKHTNKLERLYRFDVPPLNAGEHVFVFGQRQGSGDTSVMENFFVIDNIIFFTSKSFFVPDMFSGFTGLIEVPGDPGAITILDVFSSDYICKQPEKRPKK